ncbi:hypothetical protein DFH27DRAFT_616447 [Peziza echinospora]|nr:hypothetical protein DFH27DRAFT_616447 [Peziza echinospora]
MCILKTTFCRICYLPTSLPPSPPPAPTPENPTPPPPPSPYPAPALMTFLPCVYFRAHAELTAPSFSEELSARTSGTAGPPQRMQPCADFMAVIDGMGVCAACVREKEERRRRVREGAANVGGQ